MPQNLSAQFVCPSPKILDFNEERLHWASVVRGLAYFDICLTFFWLTSFLKGKRFRVWFNLLLSTLKNVRIQKLFRYKKFLCFQTVVFYWHSINILNNRYIHKYVHGIFQLKPRRGHRELLDGRLRGHTLLFYQIETFFVFWS